MFELRLPPGARLTETQLAETFNVSRTIIRQVIARLAQDGVLVKRSNGATHVASPSRDETRQMLAVRKMIEPEVVKALAAKAKTLDCSTLSKHLAEEDLARRAADRGRLVRLTGQFHLHLVRLTENAVLIRLITELQALVCLAILLYASGDSACPEDEHRRIFEAISAGDGSSAARLMLHHLDHIERDLRLDDSSPKVLVSDALIWLGEPEHTNP